MRHYRVDLLDEKELRVFGPGGDQLDQHTLTTAQTDEFARSVEQGFRAALPDLTGLGRRMYAWLNGPPTRWLAEARKGAPGLTLHLDLPRSLRRLPWELICEDGAFVATLANKPFTPVRRIGKADHGPREPKNRPLRVLFMACSPEDAYPVLDFEAEEQRILDATRQQKIELVVEESGTLDGLRDRIKWHGRDYFDVFHLTGHANIIDGKPIFLMEDDMGGSQQATADDIVGALGGSGPRLIFLSGCRTGQAVAEGALPSLCEAVVAGGSSCVLGWAKPVSDTAASVAAAELYHQLATGTPTDEAVAKARAKVYEMGAPDWHLLRLYADATPLDALVTPMGTKDREKLRIRQAQAEFIDAGSRVEVCPAEKFVGRRRPSQRCLRILRTQQEDRNYSEGVLLHGMGGLGKSSLAARLCDRMRDHKRLVWAGEIDEDALRLVLNDKIDEPAAAKLLDDQDMPLKNRLKRLISNHLDKAPALFVFDDFEKNVERNDQGEIRLDDQGRAILKPAAATILRDLLEAVRDTASDCRVMVTCRYRFPPPSSKAVLYEEALEHFQGAELAKKLKQLDSLSPDATTDESLRNRATELAGGNPRLMERLDRVLEDRDTDVAAILKRVEEATEAFREDTLLRALLDQQSEECRCLLALLAVCLLPIDEAAVEAVAGDVPVEPHLERADALGLIEAGIDPETRGRRFCVPGILEPLLAGEITDEERVEAARRTCQHLFRTWWVETGRTRLERGLEIHRLAMLAGEMEIAVVIGDAIATSWHNRSRFRDAERLCHATLALGEDYRILHTLARAEAVLGKTDEARAHYHRALDRCPNVAPDTSGEVVWLRPVILHNLAGLELMVGNVDRAMELWEQSLSLDDQIGNVVHKAATLHSMAIVIAQQGDLDRAMKLWEESLELREQDGVVLGKAATMHEMAGVIAQQGDVDRAMKLWEESLTLKEQIGDVQGKAVTLHEMARVIAQRGEFDRAMNLWEQSLELKERIGDVQGRGPRWRAWRGWRGSKTTPRASASSTFGRPGTWRRSGSGRNWSPSWVI